MNRQEPIDLGIGRELDAFAPEESSILNETPPENSEPYRYSCPVDHSGNMVSLRGWRRKDHLKVPPLILIHDVGEDIRMYRASAHYLCNQGLSCYGFDQRGHGESTERLGRIQRFDTLVQDLLQVSSWIRHLHGGIPPIIVGQGYGCLIGSEMIAKYPNLASGIILSAPTVELTVDLHPLRRLLIKLFADVAADMKLPKMLRPRFSNPRHKPVAHTMATRIVKGLISSDDIKVSSGFAWELLSAMDRFPQILASVKKPSLVLLPEADEVARFERVKQIISTHPDMHLLQCLSIEGLHHNPFTESEASMRRVSTSIISWTADHFPSFTPPTEVKP